MDSVVLPALTPYSRGRTLGRAAIDPPVIVTHDAVTSRSADSSATIYPPLL